MFAVMMNDGLHLRVLLICKIPVRDLPSVIAVTLTSIG